MSVVAKGVMPGSPAHVYEPREVFKLAFRAMDEAFTANAHASSLAVKALTAKGPDLGERAQRRVFAQRCALQSGLLPTWARVGESPAARIKTHVLERKAILEALGVRIGDVSSAPP